MEAVAGGQCQDGVVLTGHWRGPPAPPQGTFRGVPLCAEVQMWVAWAVVQAAHCVVVSSSEVLCPVQTAEIYLITTTLMGG